MTARLGLSRLAEAILGELRDRGWSSVEMLDDGRDPGQVDRAVGELARHGLVQLRPGRKVRCLVTVTKAGEL